MRLRNIILFLIITVLSCRDDGMDPLIVAPTSEELQKIVEYEILERDSLIVYFNDQIKFHEKHFSAVSVLKKTGQGSFTCLDTVVISYEKNDDFYLPAFLYGLRVKDEFLDSEYDIVLELRFYTSEKDFRSIEINIELYKYPYTSVQLVFEASDISSCRYDTPFYISDFSIAYPMVYVVPRAPGSLVEFNMTSHQCAEIYPVGTYLCYVRYHDGYIYTDKCHDRVVKMDAKTFKEVVQFGEEIINPWGSLEYCYSMWYIQGLDIDNDIVYVLHYQEASSSDGTFISLFSLDGEHIETMHFDEVFSDIAVHEGIVYWSLWEPAIIKRYDLKTKTYLKDLVAPSSQVYTIEISNNLFYYSDYDRCIICSIPLDDLKEVD